MPTPSRNIELKARYPDLDCAKDIVQTLGAHLHISMGQIDTYFHAPIGRLKLREVNTPNYSTAELIWYHRPDGVEFRGSDYYVVPVPDAALLKSALIAANGLRGDVRKQRDVYLFHNVRIHLDRVENLGNYIEFEAVMTEAEDEATSLARLDGLHTALGIQPEDHEHGSYSDLLGI